MKKFIIQHYSLCELCGHLDQITKHWKIKIRERRRRRRNASAEHRVERIWISEILSFYEWSNSKGKYGVKRCVYEAFTNHNSHFLDPDTCQRKSKNSLMLMATIVCSAIIYSWMPDICFIEHFARHTNHSLVSEQLFNGIYTSRRGAPLSLPHTRRALSTEQHHIDLHLQMIQPWNWLQFITEIQARQQRIKCVAPFNSS